MDDCYEYKKKIGIKTIGKRHRTMSIQKAFSFIYLTLGIIMYQGVEGYGPCLHIYILAIYIL